MDDEDVAAGEAQDEVEAHRSVREKKLVRCGVPGETAEVLQSVPTPLWHSSMDLPFC